MAEKRFYWLKLKENYLNEPKIKKLRKIAGGDTYTIIYLKMQLLSIKNEGIIQFEGIEPTFEEELALKLDEDLDNVKITLNYLLMQGLIEENNGEYLFIEASNNIGSECQSAERVRRFRAKESQSALQCNDSVTEVKRISISNSISSSNSISNNKEDKHKYGEYGWIKLTDTQYNKLCEEYTKGYIDFSIQRIDEYVQSTNNKNKYKDWNLILRRAIRDNWSCLSDKEKATINKPNHENFVQKKKYDDGSMYGD